MTPLLGCIADDFTGATDLAGMLVRAGMRTVQMIGVPQTPLPDDIDAVVVALKSRTTPAQDAIAESLAALKSLQAAGCRQFYFKYCSTFDSTERGNIGPVTDALMTALNTRFTIACPAFPENKRTIFKGHLFVGDVLLGESGMRNHPLTPMTDSNLVRVLQRQTSRKVGLISHETVAGGTAAIRDQVERLRNEGVEIAIVDAVSNDDLMQIGAACADLPLVTAGSGIALGLPQNYLRRSVPDTHSAANGTTLSNTENFYSPLPLAGEGLGGEGVSQGVMSDSPGAGRGLIDKTSFLQTPSPRPSPASGRGGKHPSAFIEILPLQSTADALPRTDGLRAVISGSCSTATQAQVAHAIEAGMPAFAVDPLKLAAGEDVVSAALGWAAPLLAAGPVLLYATASPDSVKAAQAGIGVERAGMLVEQALAGIAQGLVGHGVRQLIVAGGETSGAVVTALNVTGLRIGPQIDPGVPWTASLGDAPLALALALKSGNFGSTDFFTKAWSVLR